MNNIFYYWEIGLLRLIWRLRFGYWNLDYNRRQKWVLDIR
jgi:hypothetical protein